MECYQAGCAEKPAWQLKLTYRPHEGAEPVAVDATCACWNHRAQLLRWYSGARGLTRMQFSLRERGIDPSMADRAIASLAPIFT